MAFFSKIKTGVAFVADGMFDKFSSRFTGKKICFAKHITAKLSECEPWSDHFEVSAINGIESALKNSDFPSARGLAAFGFKECASMYCVELAEKAIEFLVSGYDPEFVLSLFTIE